MSKSVHIGSKNKEGHYERTTTWNRGRRTVMSTRTVFNKKIGRNVDITKTSTVNVGGILALVVIVLLIAGIFSSLVNGTPKTFESFLIMLSEVPDFIPLKDIFSFLTLDLSKTLPDWFSDIVEFGAGLIALLGVIIKGAVQALLICFYFLRWLFI